MEATLDTLLKYINPVIESSKKLWKSSKYFRIISIISGSLTAALLTRNIFIKVQRKYYNLPPGHYGLPLIGSGLAIINPKWLTNIIKSGPVYSTLVGTVNCVLINDPDLAKKHYSNPKTLNFPPMFANDMMFLFANGKAWSERRKIIYANLMSTMKASYVENATKKFIKTKVFFLSNNIACLDRK